MGQILIDLATFITVLVVQQVIYPGFRYYSDQDFETWHASYTRRITPIIGPLMLAQIGLSLFNLIESPSLLARVHLGFVITTWIATFTVAVPLHERLTKGKDNRVIERLIRVNGYRLIIWLLILSISIWQEWEFFL